MKFVLTRFAVVLSGCVGLALVGRAAFFYYRTDKLAFELVLLIGAGLVGGLIELWIRAGRTARLSRELSSLTRDVTDESLSSASSELRSLVRARMAGTSAMLPAAVFTTYLVGALVMIGLLGTFLGLFETLKGARAALDSTADIDALRAALSAPLLGLSRAFGASAAGVSASATLGLASVFVRHADVRFAGAISLYAEHAKEALAKTKSSPEARQARQLRAIESIDLKLESLPSAADTLRETSAFASTALESTASAIRNDMREAVRDAAVSAADAVSPIVERAFEHVSTLMAEQTSLWKQNLEEHLKVLASANALHLEALTSANALQLEALTSANALQLEALTSANALHVSSLSSASARHIESLATANALASENIRTHALASAEEEQSRSRALSEALSSVTRAVDSHVRAISESSDKFEKAQLADVMRSEQFASLIELLGDISREFAATTRSQSDQLNQLADTSANRFLEAEAHAEHRLSSLCTQIESSMSRQGDVIREAGELVRAGGAEMSAVAEAFTLAVDRYRDANEKWLETVDQLGNAAGQERKSETSTDSSRDSSDLLGEYIDQTREVFDTSLQFQRELFTELRALRDSRAAD